MKKTIIIILAILLIASSVLAVTRNQNNIIHDFGIEENFSQSIGHHYRPNYDIELYSGYKTKQISFNINFENTPTLLCKCYQDDNLFRWYGGQLQCEATEITNLGFRGTCHYNINTIFKKENGNIYTPSNIKLHWTADNENIEDVTIFKTK